MAGLTDSVIICFLAATLFCGFVSLRGLGNASVAKRWYFKPFLFIACLLPAFSVSAVVLSLALRVGSPLMGMASWPLTLRLVALIVPASLLCLALYLALLREVKRGGGR